MPVIPALIGLRKDDFEFKAQLGYLVGPCLKKEKRIRTETN
jgi:hypothetical protein